MTGNIEIKIRLAKNPNRVVRVVKFDNLVLNAMKMSAVRLLGGYFGVTGTNYWIDRMQFGTGIAAESVSDEHLQQPITPVKDVTVLYPYDGLPNDFMVKFTAYLQDDEANGFPISEMGLLAENGSLLARKTFGAIDKTNEYIIEFNWTIRT